MKKQGPCYTHTHVAVGCCKVVFTILLGGARFRLGSGGGCLWLAIVRETIGDRARRGRTACEYRRGVKRTCVHH
jgi:hypothetical protein